MYNDYIYHSDHKYLARIKTAGNKYRYFYSQKAYDAYKKLGTTASMLKAVGGLAKSAYDRKKINTQNRRTDVFSEWDNARRKEYLTNAVNAAGPGGGQTALSNWNNMISNFGNAVWNADHQILIQPTVATSEAYENYYGKNKKSYGIRPKSRKKNVTGKAKENSLIKRRLARFTSRRKAV